MRLGRSSAKDPNAALIDRFAEAADAARRRDYADGVRDGFEIALTLALGERSHGGIPYAGTVDPEFERWARTALANLAEASL